MCKNLISIEDQQIKNKEVFKVVEKWKRKYYSPFACTRLYKNGKIGKPILPPMYFYNDQLKGCVTTLTTKEDAKKLMSDLGSCLRTDSNLVIIKCTIPKVLYKTIWKGFDVLVGNKIISIKEV